LLQDEEPEHHISFAEPYLSLHPISSDVWSINFDTAVDIWQIEIQFVWWIILALAEKANAFLNQPFLYFSVPTCSLSLQLLLLPSQPKSIYQEIPRVQAAALMDLVLAIHLPMHSKYYLHLDVVK